MNRLMWIVTLIIAMQACKTEPVEQPAEISSESLESDTTYLEVTVNNLRMRSEPTLTSNTLVMLPEGAKVQYWDEHSDSKSQITLRGEPISEYWFKVKYGKQSGWVFGGALRTVEKKEAFDYLIVPGQRVGPIQAGDSEQNIINRLGGEVVERGEFAIGEGESVTVTYVFPSTENELILFWDQEDFTNLREVRIRKKAAKWKFTNGIGIGSSLKEVQAANGGPFQLSGFEWDYAGTTTNWLGGSFTNKVNLIFEPPAKIHKTLIGDQNIASDNPRMIKANPQVMVMRVLF
ncbi:MAG: SH3 domain-containing protein [Saprospiraceae bacterium]|nr:SH3 domain-containing protein [Saprospiraceae bacterium]